MTEAEIIKTATPWLKQYKVVGIRTQEPPFELALLLTNPYLGIVAAKPTVN